MNQPEKIKSTDIKNKTFAEFFKKKKTIVILCLIILIGAYFRLSGFHDLLRFNADQVRDAKIVDAMFEKNDFPLLGPKAGGTGFKLGPAFYYMEYVSGLIFGKSPAGIASFIPILAIFSIPLLFLLLSFYFPRHISLALTFLYAISFYAIRYSRFDFHFNFYRLSDLFLLR
jgi:4-amino-4-deoxy-L-arabinose transferase-like glycosyltransferase